MVWMLKTNLQVRAASDDRSKYVVRLAIDSIEMDIDERPHYDAIGVRLGAVGTTESNSLVANGNLPQVRGV